MHMIGHCVNPIEIAVAFIEQFMNDTVKIDRCIGIDGGQSFSCTENYVYEGYGLAHPYGIDSSLRDFFCLSRPVRQLRSLRSFRKRLIKGYAALPL